MVATFACISLFWPAQSPKCPPIICRAIRPLSQLLLCLLPLVHGLSWIPPPPHTDPYVRNLPHTAPAPSQDAKRCVRVCDTSTGGTSCRRSRKTALHRWRSAGGGRQCEVSASMPSLRYPPQRAANARYTRCCRHRPSRRPNSRHRERPRQTDQRRGRLRLPSDFLLLGDLESIILGALGEAAAVDGPLGPKSARQGDRGDHTAACRHRWAAPSVLGGSAPALEAITAARIAPASALEDEARRRSSPVQRLA